MPAGYLEHDVAPKTLTKISLKCSLFFIFIISFFTRNSGLPLSSNRKIFKKFHYDVQHIRRKVTTNGEAPLSTDTRI